MNILLLHIEILKRTICTA